MGLALPRLLRSGVGIALFAVVLNSGSNEAMLSQRVELVVPEAHSWSRDSVETWLCLAFDISQHSVLPTGVSTVPEDPPQASPVLKNRQGPSVACRIRSLIQYISSSILNSCFRILNRSLNFLNSKSVHKLLL